MFQFHRWQTNLRILDVETVQPVPQVLWSHPFIERLIATIRGEYLDRLFFWTAADLERKLELFKNYYNAARMHQGLSGDTLGKKRAAQHLRLPGLRITIGKAIATGCLNCQSPLEWHFAILKIEELAIVKVHYQGH
jgi:hypothetical protein